MLGLHVHSTGRGLLHARDEDLVSTAFTPEWWNGSQMVWFNANGTTSAIPLTPVPQANGFRQIEAGFRLFWGLAVQLYPSTLVSDDMPFDSFAS